MLGGWNDPVLDPRLRGNDNARKITMREGCHPECNAAKQSETEGSVLLQIPRQARNDNAKMLDSRFHGNDNKKIT